jgi:hypothetical protein
VAHQQSGFLVHQQPVVPRLGNGSGKAVEFDWFDDVTVDAEFITADQVALFPRRRQGNNRNEACPWILAHGPQYLQPVDLGQLQVEQDNLGVVRRELVRIGFDAE